MNRYSMGLFFAILMGHGTCGLKVHADSPRPQADATSNATVTELSRWIEDLQSSKFTVRREAFLQLWSAGKPALPAVSQAKASESRRVAEAAATLEMLIELEVVPEHQEESSRLLDGLSNPSPQAIIELCERKYWTVAERMLRENSELMQKFQEPYGRSLLGRVVDAAVNQNAPELAWPIVQRVTPPPQNVWIAQRTGLKFESQDAFSESQQLFFSNRVADALQVKNPAVVQVPFITRSGQWARVLDEPIMTAIAGRTPSISQKAVQAVLHEVAGQYARSQEIWAEVLKPPQAAANQENADAPVEDELESETEAGLRILHEIDGGGQGGQTSRHQFMAALIFSGNVEPVEQYIENEDPVAAFGFYLTGGKHAMALKALGLDADLSNFDDWLEEKKSEIVENFRQRNPESIAFDECARMCGTLSSLGFSAQAQSILDELIGLARKSRGQQDELWSRSLLIWLGRSEARVMILKAAQSEFGHMSSECQAAVLRGLFPEFSDAAELLWKTAPGDDEESKWRACERLYALDRTAFGSSPRSTVAAWLRRAAQGQSDHQLTASHLMALSEIASGIGDSELALELLLTDLSPGLGQSNSVNLHWIEAARILVQRGTPEKALSLFEAVRKSGNNPQYAYVEEIETQLLCGKFQQAQMLEVARWLRPLATTSFYQGYNYRAAAREFSERNQSDRAVEYGEAAFQLADVGSMDVYWSANDLSDTLEPLGETQRRADILRAAWVESLQPFASSMHYMFSNGYYSSLRHAAQKEKLARAMVCIANRDMPGFLHHWAVSRRLQPQDIEMACQCYPLLLKAGENEIAENLFVAYEAAMEAQIEAWPRDSTALNNLAWMYSQCDRKLDQALQLSKQAVELAPNSPIFLDTMAEIQYRSGHDEEARETMRDCVRMDPRDLHYRENLARFAKPYSQN